MYKIPIPCRGLVAEVSGEVYQGMFGGEDIALAATLFPKQCQLAKWFKQTKNLDPFHVAQTGAWMPVM